MKKAKTILMISALLLTFMLTKTINVMQDTQIWKAVPAYVGEYEVPNTGLIRNSQGKILKTYIRTGYHAIKLKANKAYYVHRLVAIAFIDNPLLKPHINHKNGIKTDCLVENLEWVTCSENRKHSFSIGLNSNLGLKNPSAKLKEEQVLKIREKRNMGYTLKRIADEYDISPIQVSRITLRQRWKHI